MIGVGIDAKSLIFDVNELKARGMRVRPGYPTCPPALRIRSHSDRNLTIRALARCCVIVIQCAVSLLIKEYGGALVEQYVDGREFSVLVVGRKNELQVCRLLSWLTDQSR